MDNDSATAENYLRGIIHCHSKFSHDSLTSVTAYIDLAERKRLNFIILTDHDATGGSLALQNAAAHSLPHLQVPTAAEYLTDEGDVIAAFMDGELISRNFEAFIREARARKALLTLPHPYVGHRYPERIAPECDLIETVNCRTRDEKNMQATLLAQSLAKPAYAASDAHFANSIADAILEVENLGSLRTSLLKGKIRWAPVRITPRWQYGASQLIKAWKKRDSVLALKVLRHALEEVRQSRFGVGKS
jgi:predicted metal-dependent phosphoesterase TrpH